MNKKIWQVLKSTREIEHRRGRAQHKRALRLHPENSTYARVMSGRVIALPEVPAVKLSWWRRAWAWLKRRTQ
mgnify:CR=1 FL=1